VDPISPIVPGSAFPPGGAPPVERVVRISRERDRPPGEDSARGRRQPPAEPPPDDDDDEQRPRIDIRV
jgi:hypothetical protein